MRVFKWLAPIVVSVVMGLAVATGLFLYAPSEYEARLAKVARLAERGVADGRWPGVMWAVVTPG